MDSSEFAAAFFNLLGLILTIQPGPAFIIALAPGCNNFCDQDFKAAE